MKKGIFKLILGITVISSLLSGCGSDKDTSAVTKNVTTEPAKKEELTFVNYRDIRDLNPHL